MIDFSWCWWSEFLDTHDCWWQWCACLTIGRKTFSNIFDVGWVSWKWFLVQSLEYTFWTDFTQIYMSFNSIEWMFFCCPDWSGTILFSSLFLLLLFLLQKLTTIIQFNGTHEKILHWIKKEERERDRKNLELFILWKMNQTKKRNKKKSNSIKLVKRWTRIVQSYTFWVQKMTKEWTWIRYVLKAWKV